jgi:hypothetical protein
MEQKGPASRSFYSVNDMQASGRVNNGIVEVVMSILHKSFDLCFWLSVRQKEWSHGW